LGGPNPTLIRASAPAKEALVVSTRGSYKMVCLVLVKVLKESRGNGEEFIIEVASISRTSHVNIVTLMGFCFEGSKKALIYDFMPNGFLKKFIYKENPSKPDCRLEWETIHKIALGIACGLEYLHRGCNTRILHFDIKPQIILLDENLCPKICDLALQKYALKKRVSYPCWVQEELQDM
jgi:serine/threonine protein kinase